MFGFRKISGLSQAGYTHTQIETMAEACAETIGIAGGVLRWLSVAMVHKRRREMKLSVTGESSSLSGDTEKPSEKLDLFPARRHSRTLNTETTAAAGGSILFKTMRDAESSYYRHRR